MKSRFPFLGLFMSVATIACGGSGDESSPAPSSGSSTNPNEPAGSSGSSGTPPTSPSTASPCASATKVLCERACACGEKGTCVVGYVVDGATSASVTEEHDSLTDCQNFYAIFVCAQATQAAAYGSDACRAALPSAACVPSSSKGAGVAFPEACRAPK